LIAAIFAARAGADGRVVVLERTRDGGRKILISGGGRCNVLPSELAPQRFVTDSSANTLRNLLRSWPLPAQRAFFEETLGVPLKLEPETGKLFPVSDRARDVRDALVTHARRLGVTFRFDAQVTDITPPAQPDGDNRPTRGPARADSGRAVQAASSEVDTNEGGSGVWTVRLADGATLAASAIILATGGLSVPATGSDGVGLRLLRALGHRVHDTYPALTPLLADPAVHESLSGVSLTATLRAPAANGARPATATGGFLFTHRGYSGPAVLDVSHLAVRARLAGRAQAQPLFAQWTPYDEDVWRTQLTPTPGGSGSGSGGSSSGGGLVVTRLRQHLPNRLADWLTEDAGVSLDQSLATLTREQRQRLVSHLCRYPLPWTADEGYKKAEVTGGGLALDEVDPRTLQSRRHAGLFCCGELLDAFGPIGGHNFAWAWATGRLAGLGAAAAST
jgi:predicted Rossmann fold flavoprotein